MENMQLKTNGTDERWFGQNVGNSFLLPDRWSEGIWRVQWELRQFIIRVDLTMQ